MVERDQPFRAGLDLSQRVQYQERLVRRALIAATPDVQIAEFLYQSIRFRQRLTDYQASISDESGPRTAVNELGLSLAIRFSSAYTAG